MKLGKTAAPVPQQHFLYKNEEEISVDQLFNLFSNNCENLLIKI